MKTIVRALLSRGKLTVLAVVTALTLATATTAFAGSGVNGVFNLGVTNSVDAITTLVGTVAGPNLRIDNNSTGSAATALDLQVEPGKAPMKVNSGTKVTNLNADKVDGKDSTAFLPSNGTAVDADKVDGKHADELSRVAVMNTGDTTPLPTDGSQVTYGQQLTITAPTAGFVRVNGNVTVLNSGCTSGCQFTAYVQHINSGALSIPQQEEATNTYGNAGLDAVFPVDAGVNTFDIRVARSGTSGTLYGWWGVLTAEYTPYGSTGTSTLDATGVSTTSQTPKHKTLPER